MKGFLGGLLGWFKGKKTILGGVLVIGGAVAGVWYGKLDPASALTVAGVGLSIAGYGSKANRHQAELLTALQDVAKAGADVRAGKPLAGELQAMAGQLVPAVVGEATALGGASLHISGSTADEVASLAKQVLAPQVTQVATQGSGV